MEGGATAVPILGPDSATVRGDDSFADRQAEADASTTALLRAIELGEDLRLVSWRQTGAAVGDLDLDLARPAEVGRDRNFGPGRRVLGRVLEEVHEDLLEQDRVVGN